MKVLQRLTELDAKQIRQLEINALAQRSGPAQARAEEVLAAIDAERRRRSDLARLTNAAAAERVRQKVQSLPFKERVTAAFTDLPPLGWEMDTLKALLERPGATTEELSEAVGYSGAYMNWFGHVCRDREPWLGPAQPRSDGRTIYSDLLVDFVARKDVSTGQSVTEWRLKPEARDALQELALV